MNDPMAHDPLERLLCRADWPVDEHRDAADMAARSRRLLSRRRRVKGLGMVVVVLTSALLLSPRRHETPAIARSEPQTWSAERIAIARAELDGIRREADTNEQMVKLLLASERRAIVVKREARSEVLDPATEVLLEQERAASILVQSGDRLAGDASSRAAAQQEYQRVLELFPKSNSAQQARRRLAQMSG